MKDKVVLITGASSGIGAATARALAAEGSQLVLCARRLDRLEKIAAECKKLGSPKTEILRLDVTDKSAVAKTIGPLKRVDALINNAGLALGREKIQEGRLEDWDVMIDTNIKGLLYVTKAVLPKMIAQKSGHIVNLGSIAGHEPYPLGNVYCATKHAVRALNQAIQMDLVDQPIRVSSVDPGMVETEFSVVRFHGDEKAAKKVYEDFHPLGPEDVADAIVFLLTRPAHVNVRELVLLPTHQASATVIHRSPQGGRK